MFEKKRNISKVAQNILQKRYYSPGEKSWEDVANRVIESIIPDAPDERKELTRKMITNTYFVPNSPCLVNAGRPNGGLSACVPGYTRIPTNDGLLPISDVVDNKVGTYVFDGVDKVKIIGRKNSGIKKVIRITTERGHTLDLTEDHRVLVYNNKEANSISKWETVSKLKNGDILEFSNRGSDFPSNDFNKNLAIFMGYLYTDGCFTRDGRNGSRILDIIVNSEYEATLLSKINILITGEDNLHIMRNDKYIRLRGYGTSRYSFLEKYEPFFSNICRVPNDIYESNKESIGAFISAVFSADGYISVVKKGATVGLGMSNEMFIRDIGRLLEHYGIRYSICKNVDKRNDYNRLDSYVLTITDKFSQKLFLDNIGFINPQKMEKLESYLKENPLTKLQNHRNNLKLKVVNKEVIGDYHVYDIQTESEKFLADNFVVHNCFVVDFPDTIEGIYKTKLDFALIARKGGGCGVSLSQIRPEGSPVAGSTHGYAGGPLKFADTISHDAEALTQAGFRSMAIMFTQSVYHPDIIKFITAKTEEGKIANANMSVTVDDDFMRAVVADEEYWTRFKGKKYDKYRARDIFEMIIEGMWKNGEPGILFYNRINDSPYKYIGEELTATNPCSEQPLSPNGSCNLGSLDLSKFLDNNGEFDWSTFEVAIRYGMRFLDSVVDKGQFPTPDIAKWAEEHRAVGLGVMGYADLLLMKEIAYGSQEAIKILEDILSFMEKISVDESEKMGIELGVPEKCKLLPAPRRNITTNTIAPTGTVSIIAGCSSGIEPIFSEITVRNDKTGTYTFENDLAGKPYFRCAVSSNGAREVTWEEHIETLATAQKYIQSGVSKTINFPNNTKRENIANAVMMAWQKGCKGVAVYRNGSRKVEVLSPQNIKKDKCPVCNNDMVEINGEKRCIFCKKEITGTASYYD